MLIPLSWKVEELEKLLGTKEFQSLSETDKKTINSIAVNGANSNEELVIYNSAMTSVLMATKEFSGSTIAVKEIFKAKLNPMIKDIPYNELVDKCTQLILWVHAQLNLDMSDEKERGKMLGFTIDSFCSTLQKYNTTLTIPELQIAFDFGYQKKYGDYFGLSNATYFNWIREFTFCDDRTKATKLIVEAKENIINPPPEKLTPEEANEKLRIGSINAWKDAQAGKEVLDIGNATYNFLDLLKLIPFDVKTKNQMMDKAKQQLIDEQKDKLLVVNEETKIYHASIKELIEQYRKGIPAPTEKNPDAVKPHHMVVAYTKRLALKTFFNELIQTKVDFIDLLDNAFNQFFKNNK